MAPDRKIQIAVRFFTILAFTLGALAADLAAAPGRARAETPTRIGPQSDLPLPRYAALKTEVANLRLGPGSSYAIRWELHGRGLPVRVIGEYDVWRRVELFDGDRGWVHHVLLTTKRHVVAAGDGVDLFAAPADDARLVAREPAATPLRLISCTRDWCEAEGREGRGWAPKRRLWGVDAGEVFD